MPTIISKCACGASVEVRYNMSYPSLERERQDALSQLHYFAHQHLECIGPLPIIEDKDRHLFEGPIGRPQE